MLGPNTRIFLVGVQGNDHTGHRFIYSETWLTNDPPLNPDPFFAFMQSCAFQMTHPFGTAAQYSLTWANPLVQQIYPVRRWVFAGSFAPITTAHFLNVNAPEASFRLQRVGASGAIGRLAIPILDDSVFTDLPHRRHIDLATMNPLLTANLQTLPRFATFGTATIRNVIFHRRTFTWENVVSYRLLVNPIRIWQRWRGYDWSTWHAADTGWIPPHP